MQCQRCGGHLLYDGIEAEFRCLQCGRAKRSKPVLKVERQKVTPFRRKWDVAPEELIADCGG
jgi:tRNA(Ile2) C34 agmatinyltransferase TiaS